MKLMALQATHMGLCAHGMTGFDVDRSVSELAIPTAYQANAMFAVGHAADRSTLAPALLAKEQPSGRRPLSELAFEGRFRAEGSERQER